MTILRFLLRHSVKAKRIKLAAGSLCEICGRAVALEDLEVHSFLEVVEDCYSPPEFEQFLLILCNRCHRDVHSYSILIEEQEELVLGRPDALREEIRKILAYAPKPYTPPEVNLEDAYTDASSPHHFGFGV